MALRLYNTLTKREEPLKTVKQGVVSMYTCGPTVYGRPHIGNYSSFLMADLLRRWLDVSEYKVTHVKNITDVGHLVADRDEGEDKIEKQAQEEFGEVTMQSVLGIARKYEAQYLEDEKALNMVEPKHRPRATEFIPEMREMVEVLLQKGLAYALNDAIYFDVTGFQNYGKLSGNTVENLAAGSRVEVNEEKKHSADFALWKFCVGPNAHHVLRWPSPHGVKGETYPEGFPGWHIECSAMSRSLLGDQIDLHTGGEDNIFPHHECEIAQSESVTGKIPFVRLWLHRRRIDLAGEKMSKSLGNVLTLPHILERGYSALDLRYYLLSVHYRTHLKFTWKGMDDARKARKKVLEWMEEVGRTEAAPSPKTLQAGVDSLFEIFDAAMDNDLNAPAALAAVFDAMNAYRRAESLDAPTLRKYREFLERVRAVFGCFEPEMEEEIPDEVRSLINERARARTEKNFAESDRLRRAIRDRGYEVRDTDEGQQVKRL